MPNISRLKGLRSLANWAASMGTPERWQGIQTHPFTSLHNCQSNHRLCQVSDLVHILDLLNQEWERSGPTHFVFFSSILPHRWWLGTTVWFVHPRASVTKYRRTYVRVCSNCIRDTAMYSTRQLITDGWDEGGIECIFREAHEDTRLANAAVSNEQQLEQEVVRFGHIVLGSRPVYRPRRHVWEAYNLQKASSKENSWTGRLVRTIRQVELGRGRPLPIRFTVTWTAAPMT